MHVDLVPSAVVSSSEPTPAPDGASTLDEGELTELARRADRCGRAIAPGERIDELRADAAPVFEGIVGPKPIAVAREVDFGRLSSFVQAFAEHGAGIEWVLRRDGVGGTFFLSVEGQPELAPLRGDDACARIAPGTWQLHVRGRQARLRSAGDASRPWQSLADLPAASEALRAEGAPSFVTLNATRETRAEVAALALARVVCAAGPSEEEALPLQILLGEIGCE